MHSSTPRHRGFTPPRRSGITHLASPEYATGYAATSLSKNARPLASTSAPPAATAAVSTLSTWPTQRGAAAAAAAAATAQASVSASPPRHEGAPSANAREASPSSSSTTAAAGPSRQSLTALAHHHSPSSQHPPRCSSNAAATRAGAPHSHQGPDSGSWRHDVSAVCRRLEHTMQETEQVLMRVAGPDASSTQKRSAAEDAAPRCSSGQVLHALQCYRSACMAATLELEALQQRHPPAPFLHASAAATHDSPRNGLAESKRLSPPPPPSQAVDVAQLQQRYKVMESRLTKTLVAQAAYMKEITLQQHQREREGIMAEYLWTARLLVEQEDAERDHLHILWSYIATSATTTTTVNAITAVAAPSRSRRQASEVPVVAEATPVEPLPPPPMKSTAAAAATSSSYSTTSPRPGLNGHGDAALERLATHNAHLTRELAHAKQRAHALLQEQQRDLQAAQERVLAQLVARHSTETAELEERVQQAEERLRSALHDAACTSAPTAAPPGPEDGARGTLQQQLKDTTKRMWQLHLVNDQLDAKVRVLEREVEELRERRSPLRKGERQQNGHRDGSGSTAEVEQASELPPPLRITSTAARSPSGSTRPAVQPVTCSQPSPCPCPCPTGTALNGGGVSGGRHGISHSDVRYGQSLACAAAASNSGGGRSSRSVGSGVWIGYDERSTYLATTTTPMKHQPAHHQQHRSSGPSHCSSTSSVHSTRWADEALPPQQRLPTVCTSQQQQQQPAWIDVSGDVTTVDVPRMSEDNNNHSGGGGGSVGYSQGDGGASLVQPQRSFTRTHSPVRQLSLDRTPAPLPSRGGGTAHIKAGASGAMRSAADDCRDRYSESGETDNEYDNTSAPVRAEAVVEGATADRSVSSSPDCDDDDAAAAAARRLTAPHGAGNTGRGVGDASSSSQAGGGGDGLDDEEAAAPTAPSSAPSSCTSPTATAPRARLEAVRRDILRHAERLEQEVQAVTSRHDAARRQRRRERDTLRVNLSVHSAKSSLAPSMSREDPDSADHIRPHAQQDSWDAADKNDDEESDALNRALEELHIEQQEEDDALEQYYNDVNQKRTELERCLRVVEEKLAALA